VPILQDQSDSFGRFEIGASLGEALQALNGTLRDLSEGKYHVASDEMHLLIDLSLVLNKLCVAWHRRTSTYDEVVRESQEDYEAMTTKIPDWGGRFTMVESGVMHGGIPNSVYCRMSMDTQTIGDYLRAAEVALRDLMEMIERVKFDPSDIDSLGSQFAPVLSNLCLAWHLRYLTPAEVSALEATTIDEIGHWIPPWQWLNVRLIPQDMSAFGTD
jgi:hypothetical protein